MFASPNLLSLLNKLSSPFLSSFSRLLCTVNSLQCSPSTPGACAPFSLVCVHSQRRAQSVLRSNSVTRLHKWVPGKFFATDCGCEMSSFRSPFTHTQVCGMGLSSSDPHQKKSTAFPSSTFSSTSIHRSLRPTHTCTSTLSLRSEETIASSGQYAVNCLQYFFHDLKLYGNDWTGRFFKSLNVWAYSSQGCGGTHWSTAIWRGGEVGVRGVA